MIVQERLIALGDRRQRDRLPAAAREPVGGLLLGHHPLRLDHLGDDALGALESGGRRRIDSQPLPLVLGHEAVVQAVRGHGGGAVGVRP